MLLECIVMVLGGGDPEIQTLAAMLSTTIYSYSETLRVGLDLGAMKCMA